MSWVDFWKTTYPLDKNFFLIPRFSWSIIGFYPETQQTWIVRCWAFVNFFILTYGCIAELSYGISYIPINIAIALDAICPVASSIMSWVKMGCIWWNRAEFLSLIQRLRELTQAQNSDEKIKVKMFYYAWATRLSWMVLWLGFWTSMAYSIRLVYINSMHYFHNEPIIYETPFKMIFPDVLLRMPLYPLTFLLSHYHGYITVCCFAGGDGLFLCFCFYFTILLKSLSFDLKKILRELSSDEKLSRATEDEVCRQLRDIIDRHNEIVSLTDRFSAAINVLTLGHFVTSGMIIGTSVIDLFLFSGVGIFVYVVYTSAVTTEIFLYCVGGTAVIESSAELATVAYCSHWHSHSLKVQKMVLLLIIRSQRSLVIKVPFVSPSLPALTSILRFTGSLIALANSVI